MARIDFLSIQRDIEDARRAIREKGNKSFYLELLIQDLTDVLNEHERFTSNYVVALGFIDNFVNLYANAMPEAIGNDARELQARLRGLL